MPYVSDAQRRFFHSAGAKKAGISDKDVEEYDRASKGVDLPERVQHHNDLMREAVHGRRHKKKHKK